MNYKRINHDVMLDTKHQYENVPELVAAVAQSISLQYMVAQEDVVNVPHAVESHTECVVSG